MTDGELAAIRILSESVQHIAETNGDAHKDIINRLEALEKRLCSKLEELKQRHDRTEKRLDEIKVECTDRERRCSILRSEAMQSAVVEAKAPGIYAMATMGLGRFMVRVLAVLASLGAFVTFIILLLERTGIIGG